MKKILLAAAAVFLLSVTGGCDKIKQFFGSEKFPVENVAAADSVTTSDGLFATRTETRPGLRRFFRP